MSSNRGHVLALPTWTLGLRIAQIVLAIAILGIMGYAATFFLFDGIAINLFMAIATIIIVAYAVVSTLFFPIAYNYWALLGLDIFGTVLWLVSFALLASEASYFKRAYVDGFSGYSSGTSGSTCYEIAGSTYCYKAKRATTTYKSYYGAIAAASAFGAIEFVTFVVSLVFVSLYLHRHRKAGGHCTTKRIAALGSTSVAEHEKHHPAAGHELQQQQVPQYQEHQQQVYEPGYEQQQVAPPQTYDQGPEVQYQQQPINQVPHGHQQV